jgi:uncharacterized membrane protein YphA (DoxX/SURF4 family)
MSIDSYQLLPLKAVELVARTLPWFELAVGLLLIAGFWLRSAAAATALLLAVFFGLMVRAYAKGWRSIAAASDPTTSFPGRPCCAMARCWPRR